MTAQATTVVRSAAVPRGEGLLVVAAAGYGKTTVLEGVAAGAPVRVHAAADLSATALAQFVTAARPSGTAAGGSVPDGFLVVDDLGNLPYSEQVRLARALGLLPDDVRISLGSRQPVHPRVISALRRPLLYRGPADLTLSGQDVARVLREEHDVPDPDLAPLVSELTAGWPMLVHLAGAALSSGAGGKGLLTALAGPGTAGAVWIQEHVLAKLPPDVRRVLELAVELDPVSLPLLAAIAGTGEFSLAPERITCAVEWLTATGLLVPARARTHDAAMRVVPLIGQTLTRASRPTSALTPGRRRMLDGRHRRRAATAAGWYAANGHHLAAARALVEAGDTGAGADLIEARGADMIAAGAAAAVIALIERLPAAERARYAVRLVHGDALRTIGEPAAAEAVFAVLAGDPQECTGLPPALAWRLGMLHYMRGDYPRAEAECARRQAEPGSGGATLDTVLTDVCRASALAALGESASSADLAARALADARRVGSDRALAAAHVAVALTSAGARRDEQLAQALVAAERGCDLLAQARILTNEVDGLLRQARYRRARDLAVRAVQVAEQGSPPGLLATALCNEGEVLLRLGEFTDSAVCFERAARTSRRVGLNRTALALWGLAAVHRTCGRREQARAMFEEAVDLARDAGDVQVLVPALTGLARLLLDGPPADLALACAHAEEAQRVAPPRFASMATVGVGWVRLAAGDLAAARAAADEAVRVARCERRMDHLAEALELAAAVSAEPAQTRSLLVEAETIWRQAGAVPFADRMTMLVGRLPGASGAERSAGTAAARRLTGLGMAVVANDTEDAADSVTAPVRVRVLGGFEVLVAGRPVPFTAWRSKQARTLVKILVARRGRPVLRGELCELLWPDDDPARTAHRLSVLLSVVRAVLDPQHVWPVDHYLRADQLGLSLDPAHIAVDAEGLLRDAAHARRLTAEGRTAQARQILTDVDRLYRGTAFEEEPCEDWAHGLREEVRAVWLRSLRELADLSRAAGDLRQAATVLTRLLGADPYDEDAHHLLVRVMVRTRRHGEARRALQRWTEAMHEIGAPAPDPDVLGVPARAAGAEQR